MEHTDRSGHLKVHRSDENIKSAESCLFIKMCKYLRGGPVRFRQIVRDILRQCFSLSLMSGHCSYQIHPTGSNCNSGLLCRIIDEVINKRLQLWQCSFCNCVVAWEDDFEGDPL